MARFVPPPPGAYEEYREEHRGEAPQARGASGNPANRFEKLRVELEPVEPTPGDDAEAGPRRVPTIYFRDQTRTIIARNSSPDIGFETSLNPYRGCEHGCAYCFARPFHEYLGFSAGLDFETRILVKEDAPKLLAAELSSPKWQPQVLMMSGVTDPYQPVERRLKITRGCLEVLARFRNPVGILTKNALVTRDLDLFKELASHRAVAVNLSITSLDRNLQQRLEPRTSPPQARLEAVAQLREAGVPVGVMIAPIIPGLNEHEVPALVAACAEAGAQFAGHVLLRLPGAVAPVFERWLAEHFPERQERVLGRLREMRGGKLYDAKWGERQRGKGIFAEQIGRMFEVACRRHGLKNDRPELSAAAFRRPIEQMSLL